MLSVAIHIGYGALRVGTGAALGAAVGATYVKALKLRAEDQEGATLGAVSGIAWAILDQAVGRRALVGSLAGFAASTVIYIQHPNQFDLPSLLFLGMLSGGIMGGLVR